ncbi:cytochrome c oxidase, subunit VIb [Durotheca rogersii]|uniref:cytochrome c oxidase, subunit VIb n=1 Tax=Durotheca rogersii TaxID=419775 RepID=UPI00221E5B18|nr:cytochrome c oxidase, subunit VIb [Durotheca rogersii]KAI5864227.1 cytochrome c oxidase, subunit VIb [Durotheca rogersii]
MRATLESNAIERRAKHTTSPCSPVKSVSSNATGAPLGVDARFPNQNQTKHCWQNYVDYHKCINAKGEDFPPCRQFFLAYRSLCPSGWYERWDDQREAGNFPVKLDA